MRVLIINTSEKTGGAAVAANRLKDALNNNGVKAKMLVRDKLTDDITVAQLPRSPLLRWHFLRERLRILLHLRLSKKHLWEIDTATDGTDITSLPEFQEADVIHLSWVNQGMLSLKALRKIIKSGKPVIWTMHDLWSATGICHYTRGCDNFLTGCGQCPLLPNNGNAHDLSARIWKRKQETYGDYPISFVACSKWLEKEAKRSPLLAGKPITSIPNPINTRLYRKTHQAEARSHCDLPLDKRLILFVSQRVTDQRKGISFLIDAINKMVANHPETKQDTGIIILGGHAQEVTQSLPLPTYPLGYISDERKIVDVYNAADVFVLPSLEDNLPNTIMEAMACGLPCVGFNVGGIPEMIDHMENGYVAQYKDADDLAQGLRWALNEVDHEELSRLALHKVVTNYSQQTVAVRYIDIYQQALNHHRQHP